MVGYEAIENAVLAKMLEKFPDKLSATRCKAGDPDAVFSAIFSEGIRFGVWTEVDGGGPDSSQPFNKQVWVWRMVGIFAIQISDTIEADLREIVTVLVQLFDGDHTLGGVTPRARITGLDTPVPAEVDSIPFYWVGFSIDAFDI